MNRDEAKKLLRLHRPGSPDAEDPQMAEALAFAGQDPELTQWLEQHGRRQAEVRQQFRKITAPAGLLEQMVSEHRAQEKIIHFRQRAWLLAAAAMVAILIGLPFWFRPHLRDAAGFAVYQTQMAAIALRGYGMDVITNDPVPIRNYLAQNHAPADYVLPAALQKAALAGCAIESWQGVKTSMLCFRTGQPVAAGTQSDMWLFVTDPASVAEAPDSATPQFKKISHLATAVWRQNGKLYLLGTTADESVLRKFL